MCHHHQHQHDHIACMRCVTHVSVNRVREQQHAAAYACPLPYAHTVGYELHPAANRGRASKRLSGFVVVNHAFDVAITLFVTVDLNMSQNASPSTTLTLNLTLTHLSAHLALTIPEPDLLKHVAQSAHLCYTGTMSHSAPGRRGRRRRGS